VSLAYGGTVPAFRVRAKSPRTEILTCEPLVLDVELHNVGDAEVQVPVPLAMSGLGFAVTIVPPEGPEFKYQPLEYESHLSLRQVRIAPGKVYRRRDVLLYSGQGNGMYAFEVPGTYALRVSYTPGARSGPTFQSEALQVKVASPDGGEREALALFKGMSQVYFMYGSDKPSIPEFVKLSERYPTTVYGRFARYYMARQLVTGACGRSHENYLKAGAVFEKLIEERRSFPLADQCMVYLAECYRHTGKAEEAAKLLEELVKQYPESPVAQAARERR
jgi:tetratricopeptide (TPR) repeat protein